MADVSDPALSEAYAEIRKDSNNTNWILAGYEGNKIVLQGKGEGGLAELVQRFQDDQVQYAYARVITGDQESKRTKFVLLAFVGEKVGALKRAKVSVHKASIKSVWKDFSVEYHGETHAEFEVEAIMTKVRKAGGADYSGSLGK